jgi:hypothetical protein
MGQRRVTLNLDEEDCKWLEETFGSNWTKRMEAHIHNECLLRRRDEALKMRKPWDY